MIKFGPSGNSDSFFAQGYKHTEEAAEYCSNLGLNCFEYSFGKGILLSEGKAQAIGQEFNKFGIELSVHAPYFINLANPSEEKAQNSFNYILNSAKYAKSMGAKRVVFHPATEGKLTRLEAVELTKDRLKTLTECIYSYGLEDVVFCPETMGKLAQIGTLEEIVDFCKIDDVFLPTVDFGHLNARWGGNLKTESDFIKILEYMISELGYDRVKNFHVHFSKIMYGNRGEIKHLTFEDDIYGPEFEPLAKGLKKLNLEPHILCESAGTQAEDALEMKRIYNNL